MSLFGKMFGKKEGFPGAEGSLPIKPIPASEEGQKAMAGEKGIHPYADEAKATEEKDESVDVDLDDLK